MATIRLVPLFLSAIGLLCLTRCSNKNCPVGDFDITGANSVAPATVSFKAVSASNFDNISWSFGDSNVGSTETEPSHLYILPGVYTVTMRLSANNSCDDHIVTKEVNILAAAAPIANFEVQLPQPAHAPCTTILNNLSQNASTYLWDFGVAGASSTQQNATYTYQQPGTYEVKLTASVGSQSSTTSRTIVVTDPAQPIIPIANFEINNNLCEAPCVVSFINASVNAVSYSWDFGDNSTSTGLNPSHSYNAPNTYTVKLTATSSTNATDTETKTVTVKALDTTETVLRKVTLKKVGQYGCFLDGLPDLSFKLMVENGSNDVFSGISGGVFANATTPLVWTMQNPILDKTKTYYFEFFSNDTSPVCVMGKSGLLIMPNYNFNGDLQVDLTDFVTGWEVLIDLKNQ